MRFFLKNILFPAYFCFIACACAQENELILPQKGAEISWSNDVIVYYNKKITFDKQIEANIVAFDLISGKSVIFPHVPRIISSLAFNKFIVTVTLDGEIRAFTKIGTPIETLLHKSEGELYMSACKLNDDGIFVILSLLPLDEKKIKTYQLVFVKINDEKSYVFKRLIAKEPIRYGQLIYKRERLWILEENSATKIDFSEIDF